MELYPKRKTDAEYIATMRKIVKRSKRVAVFFVFCGMIQLTSFWFLWKMIHRLDGIMSEVSKGVHIGIMRGAMAGIFLVLASQCFQFAHEKFRGNRSEKLMLKFHDELEELKTDNQAVDNISKGSDTDI